MRNRVSLELKQEVIDRLHRVQQMGKCETVTETIRRALAIYDLIWTRREKGDKIVFVSSNGEQETVILV